MRLPKVYVLPQDIKPGEVYSGYEYGPSWTCFSEIIVGEDGIPRSWGTNEIDKEVIHFFRDMNWQEEAEWYRNNTDMTKAVNQLNLMGLHTDLYDVGDACHEMYNGWIKCDWREQLMELTEEEFFIAGVAEAPYECWSLDDSVALVAEYRKTGDRFWCHADRGWITDMREESKSVYEELMNGKM